MKKTIIYLVFTLLFCTNIHALEMLVKVGSQHPNVLDSKHGTGWRDGEIIDIRESGFHNRRANVCIIDFPNINYWTLRGSIDWKSELSSVVELKKYLSSADSVDKYRWDAGYDEKAILDSRRDYFIDFQDLLNKGFITQKQYDGIYSDIPHPPISFPDSTITGKLKEERTAIRLNEK